MLKKFTMCAKNTMKRLIEKLEHTVPGYLAYCEDCGHIKRLSYLKEAHMFMCYGCVIRHAKLYIKMNRL